MKPFIGQATALALGVFAWARSVRSWQLRISLTKA